MEDTDYPSTRDAATSAMEKGWSSKISVQGDYDQFARKPRKEKNKSRDRSPTLSEKLRKGSLPSLIQGTSHDNDNSPLNPEYEMTQKKEEVPDPRDEIRDKKSSRDELRTAGVSVTNFPDGPNNGQYVLSRLDSMPPRKQARIEHMKQLRNEPQENGATKSTPRRVPALEPAGRPEDRNALLSPQKHKNREITFTPPIASVVDFLEKSDAEKYGITSVNKSQLAEILQDGKVDPAIITRLSTRFTMGYVRVGESPPSKNVISSMVVRPILPPIKRTLIRQEMGEQKSQNRSKQIHSASLEVTPQEREGEHTGDNNSLWKSTVDMTYHFQRGSRLRQGHSKYVYRPQAHHSTTVLDATTNSPKEMLDIGGEIEDDFDRVVRWKSKIRYCGKPFMYKRSMSPTLGEEALKRKLTDRLPTRQVTRLWPEAGELYSEVRDRNEHWRRPPSTLSTKLHSTMVGVTMDDVIGSKAKALQSMRQAGQDQNTMLQETIRHQTHGIRLPPPQIPVRKWRPMWQRMPSKQKSST